MRKLRPRELSNLLTVSQLLSQASIWAQVFSFNPIVSTYYVMPSHLKHLKYNLIYRKMGFEPTYKNCLAKFNKELFNSSL